MRLRREIAAQLLMSLPLLLRRREEQSSEHDVIFDDACVCITYYAVGRERRDPGTLFLCFFEF